MMSPCDPPPLLTGVIFYSPAANLLKGHLVYRLRVQILRFIARMPEQIGPIHSKQNIGRSWSNGY